MLKNISRIFTKEEEILDFNIILNRGKTPLTEDIVFYDDFYDGFSENGERVGGQYYLGYEADKNCVVECRQIYGVGIRKSEKRRKLRIPKRITTEEELVVYIMRKPIGKRLYSDYETKMIMKEIHKSD